MNKSKKSFRDSSSPKKVHRGIIADPQGNREERRAAKKLKVDKPTPRPGASE